MQHTKLLDYQDGETVLEGYCAYDREGLAKKPAVLIAPDWSGKNPLVCEKADQLASLGYVGFAIDMYGKGITGETKEEKAALMTPLVENRAMLAKRILSAYEFIRSQDYVDANKVAVIGYCFGGLCALDLARSGADIKGAICVHGQVHAPKDTKPAAIKAKVLVLHGFSDPMIKPDAVMEFCNEMTIANVDWEVDLYGHAMHAFSNPKANDPSFGTVYEPKADKRSTLKIQQFLAEIFA